MLLKAVLTENKQDYMCNLARHNIDDIAEHTTYIKIKNVTYK